MADAPRVFLSYSHDSDEHADRVLALADALCDRGIDVILDRYVDPAPAEGWPRWMDRNLDEAQFVLMVCTATYRRRAMGLEEPGKGLGVDWEGNLIYNLIYHRINEDKPSGSRFIPILLLGSKPDHIPTPILGNTRYQIASFDFTDPGFEALYRHLTGQPATLKPELGTIKKLPPRQRPKAVQGPLPPSGGPCGLVADEIDGPSPNDREAAGDTFLVPYVDRKGYAYTGLRKVIHGTYRLKEVIGKGPTSLVILAYDEHLERHVAIKSLIDPEVAALFDDALRRVVKITKHPNIVSIYGAWLDEEPHHYVRQYVEGHSLRIELEKQGQEPLPIDFIQQVLASVGDAIHFAQVLGVDDLDIKPENILIQTKQQKLNLGLTSSYDVLLCPECGDKEMLKKERVRSAMKTNIIYFPPELFHSYKLHSPDPDRINQYRLGIVGYEMLIGSKHFKELAQKRSEKLAVTPSQAGSTDFPAWPPVETTCKGIPKFISASIDRMIDPNPNNRFRTLGDAVDVIAHRNVDVEIARDSYRRILDDVKKEREFFRMFYNRFLDKCPPARKMFEEFGFPNRSALNDLETNDPKGRWPRQFLLLKEAIILLLAFNMLKESQEPTILTRIAERHRGFPKKFFDAFREALVETVLVFDGGNYKDDYKNALRDAWEEAIRPGINYMIDFE